MIFISTQPSTVREFDIHTSHNNMGSINTSNARRIQNKAVSSTAPSDGQVLAWNSGNNQYEPTTAGGGGGYTFRAHGTATAANAISITSLDLDTWGTFRTIIKVKDTGTASKVNGKINNVTANQTYIYHGIIFTTGSAANDGGADSATGPIPLVPVAHKEHLLVLDFYRNSSPLCLYNVCGWQSATDAGDGGQWNGTWRCNASSANITQLDFNLDSSYTSNWEYWIVSPSTS